MDKFNSDTIDHDTVTVLQNTLNTYNLVDLWRIKNPETRRYTWRRHFPLTQSRLDYFFVPQEMVYCLQEVDIKPSIKTDHSLITLKLSINNENKRGPGFWKFNDSLLKDIQYVTDMKQLIEDQKRDLRYMHDKAQKWDIIKYKIREFTIQYSKETAKARKLFENEMINRLEYFTKLIDGGDSSETTLTNYQIIKHEIENVNAYQTEGARIRAKKEQIEHDEKCNTYFLQSGVRNYNIKNITKLQMPNNTSATSQHDIRRAQTTFYRNLYNSITHSDEFMSPFLENLPRLDENQISVFNKPLTIGEMTASVKLLKRGKTPGSDGLTTDFYQFFWRDISDLVYESIEIAYISGRLSTEQRRSIITLLPKANKDLTDLKNWRPISLLNTDYKILALCLAQRLQITLPSIISENQVGYIKGRSIGMNVRTIIDVIEEAKQTENTFLSFLDFEKAFDSINRNYIQNCLSAFGFPEYFITWIKIIYNETESAVLNNGFTTNYFPLKRGVRQGCPLSALLFVIVVETLAHAIRNNKHIHGVSINNIELKILQYADDTTVIVRDIHSLQICLNILFMFYKTTGLRLNTTKTEIFPIGDKAQFYTNKDPFRLNWVQDRIYALGTWFYKDEIVTTVYNTNAKIAKITDIIKSWKNRKLTYMGKITVIKSLLLSQKNYITSIVCVSTDFVNNMQKILNSFLWDNKQAKLKMTTVIADKQSGGLTYIHLESYLKAQKYTWIEKLLSQKSAFIRAKLMMYLPSMTLEDFIRCDVDPNNISLDMPAFYRQVLYAWFDRNSTDSHWVNAILWNNKNIQIANQPVWKLEWYTQGIVYIKDLIDHQSRRFFNVNELNARYNLNENFLSLSSIISAIPEQWRKELKHFNHTTFLNAINKNAVKFETSKQIYLKYKTKFVKKPSCIQAWKNQYNIDFAEDVWNEIFALPWLITKKI